MLKIAQKYVKNDYHEKHLEELISEKDSMEDGGQVYMLMIARNAG